MKCLFVTLDDLWGIHHYTYTIIPPDSPYSIMGRGKQFSYDVWKGISVLSSCEDQNEWELWCTEEELHAIAKLMHMTYGKDGVWRGQKLLPKVFAALVEIHEERQPQAYDDLES